MGQKTTRTGERSLLLDFTACALIVLSHFLNYVTYLGYDRLWPDLAVVVAVLLGIAFLIAVVVRLTHFAVRALVWAILVSVVVSDAVFQLGISGDTEALVASFVVLFVALGLVFFLREHTAKVLIGVFAAMLCSTAVMAALRSAPDDGGAPAADGRSSLPVVLHIVLDEHAGLAALTDDLPGAAALRRDIAGFYAEHGFRLFGRAYSEYFDTAPSIAGTLNQGPEDTPFRFLVKHRNKWSLETNGYFRQLAERGYRLRVYQSSYLEFCQGPRIDACFTYAHDGFDPQAIAGMGPADRVTLILDMYYSSIALVRLAGLAEKPVSRFLQAQGFGHRGLGLWHGRVGPLAVAPALRALERDLESARGGTAFFAHLLMPHYPYVYDAECRLVTPVSDWPMRTLADGTNTPQSRRLGYARYMDQIRCTMRRLDALFAAMERAGSFADATVIVHSDHGSRISRMRPLTTNAAALEEGDFLDGFSALFAVRRPGIPAGLDGRMLSLTQLHAYATGQDRQPAAVAAPRVYLQAAGTDYRPWPLPAFPALADPVPADAAQDR